jgi:hypothetical protein
MKKSKNNKKNAKNQKNQKNQKNPKNPKKGSRFSQYPVSLRLQASDQGTIRTFFSQNSNSSRDTNFVECSSG